MMVKDGTTLQARLHELKLGVVDAIYLRLSFLDFSPVIDVVFKIAFGAVLVDWKRTSGEKFNVIYF